MTYASMDTLKCRYDKEISAWIITLVGKYVWGCLKFTVEATFSKVEKTTLCI